MGRALILAAFALTGMETSLFNSGEVTRPTRTMPLVLAIAMVSVTILYMPMQLIVQETLDSALAQSAAPMADAMGRISSALRVLMLASTVFAMLGIIAGDILGTPRVVFMFARGGLLPGALGGVHPITHTPHLAILSYSALAIVLALTGSFAVLAVLVTLAFAGLYIAACIAAWMLARRGRSARRRAAQFPLARSGDAAGRGHQMLLIALASPTQITGILALVAGSAAIYLLQSRIFAHSAT